MRAAAVFGGNKKQLKGGDAAWYGRKKDGMPV